ncbi:MAG: hypothetical protein ACE5Z5_12980 [Candidatus Bathyarchaeia archaeon]
MPTWPRERIMYGLTQRLNRSRSFLVEEVLNDFIAKGRIAHWSHYMGSYHVLVDKDRDVGPDGVSQVEYELFEEVRRRHRESGRPV